MKFAHDYVQILDAENYPEQWVKSAISYRQLKKCIKRVRKELLALGLHPEVLNVLWRPTDLSASGNDEDRPTAGFQYTLKDGTSTSTLVPKLTFVIDPRDGTPVDAFLSDETLQLLRQLDRDLFPPDEKTESVAASSIDIARNNLSNRSDADIARNSMCRSVEIPLFSDLEFFHILKTELAALDDIREKEQAQLSRQVVSLRQDIGRTVNSSFSRRESALYTWREIFRLYIELQIFFSTDEADSGPRSAEVAQHQLEKFQAALKDDLRVKKLNKAGRAALVNFLTLNQTLLLNLRFQEINRTAVRKILKKFDKHTALRARAAYPEFVTTEPFLAQSMAKAVCHSISEEILSIIPQLDDYLCPICFSITFKPVRLRCNHVFCIRCLVIMQRARQNQCALCREGVVMEATGDNLDQNLLAFLRMAFPKETRIKQKENERAATMDLYGRSYDACSVM
ncbi:hypothetical protein AJ80_05297 [Polytolypa hystricis UAMH7299]|uniref:RING-14 protein n=1 Tax=Polytolypa hystricis (strain UAMH7299) TaxID=1447883 RepID=A0A2B7Y5C2_POLH7|nr:hypothetical protein AJ80_05297 [Polytolypa hystricis UAMH7299]